MHSAHGTFWFGLVNRLKIAFQKITVLIQSTQILKSGRLREITNLSTKDGCARTDVTEERNSSLTYLNPHSMTKRRQTVTNYYIRDCHIFRLSRLLPVNECEMNPYKETMKQRVSESKVRTNAQPSMFAKFNLKMEFDCSTAIATSLNVRNDEN